LKFRPGKEIPHLDVTVRGNDIEKALRDLKRNLQKEGLFRELKKRQYYEKPSVKKKRKQLEAERRRRKALRSRRPERD
jgi:small subunit ribosomal protein S21